MAIGDADLGIFFGGFGSTIVFGTQPSAKGNLDSPGKDSVFDHNAVSNTDYRLELPWNAFSPMPTVKDRLTVDGVAFAVAFPNPLDDGKIVELKLRKL